MYKGQIKLAIIAIASILVSCGGKENNAGESLIAQAQQASDSGNYLNAYSLLDSADAVSSTDISTRKKIMHMRTIVDEKSAISDSIRNDSVLESKLGIETKLKDKFKYVKTPDMVEGYTIHKSAKELIKRTGIEARINEDDEIYFISLVNGRVLNHCQIELSTSNESIASNYVAYNGSINYRFKDNGVNNEMVTFRGEKADSLGLFLSKNADRRIKLKFIGKKQFSQNLTEFERKIFAETYDYAKAVALRKKAERLKLYYANKIRIAREQQLKTAL